jgi:hypothetical protein
MVNWTVPTEICNARAVAGRAGMITCIPKVPQAVMATSNKNGARVRPRSKGVVKNCMLRSNVLRHFAVSA